MKKATFSGTLPYRLWDGPRSVPSPAPTLRVGARRSIFIFAFLFFSPWRLGG
jgi:hypothetical protein